MNDIKLAIIGLGGIGSWFVFRYNFRKRTYQFQDIESCVGFDPDVVEEKNLKHQLYSEEDVGLPKA